MKYRFVVKKVNVSKAKLSLSASHNNNEAWHAMEHDYDTYVTGHRKRALSAQSMKWCFIAYSNRAVPKLQNDTILPSLHFPSMRYF